MKKDYIGIENSGDMNSGDRNSGDMNSGDRNSGNTNSGDRNSGNTNSGNRNSGSWNSGDRNSGDWNSGHWNSGDWNSGNMNSGYMNSETPSEILVFNKLCKREIWNNAEKPDWLYINLINWIREEDMSEKEKKANPEYVTTGGYLKVYSSLHHAYIEAWGKVSEEDRELTFKLPNFDIEVFKEVFGFTPTLDTKKKIIIDGKEIEISEESYNEFKKQFNN